MRTGSTARRAGALTALCGVVLAVSATLAGPAAAGDGDGPALASCGSTDENNGSGSHVLTFNDDESSTPYEGGSVTFTLLFPDDGEGDGTFMVEGCVYLNGVAVDMWPAREISNGVPYTLPFDVPAGAVTGDTVCISAKTTAGPSAPLRTNRKALGCFDVQTEDVVESESPEPSESSSPEPSVEPSDPDPTITPSVRGVRLTQAPAAPTAPTLPNTGAASGLMLAVGLGLVVVGGTFVARAGRYQRQH